MPSRQKIEIPKYKFSHRLLLKPARPGSVDAILGDDGTVLTAGNWLLSVVGTLHTGQGFTRRDFQAALLNLGDVSLAESVFCTFLAAKIIVPFQRYEGGGTEPELSWREAGWEIARVFHEATAFAEFLQGDPEGWQEQMRQSAQIGSSGSGPPMTKSYIGKHKIRLEERLKTPRTDFFKVLTHRRTCRKFLPDRTITFNQLSALLHYSARAQTVVQDMYLGPHILRTSPSGGARHPVEIYPQLLRVEGMNSGSFYYDPVSHELTRLGDTSEDLIYQMGQKQSGCRKMPIAFLITARFIRNMWKYRYPKSYLFTLLDVGHFAQTLILCCEALGFKCFLTPALDVSLAQKHLKLPNIFDECSTYLITCG